MMKTKEKQIKPKSDKNNTSKGLLDASLGIVGHPDIVEVINVNRRRLNKNGKYRRIGVEKRQVFDVDKSKIVTEYRAEILKDGKGNRFVAPFPRGITRPVQYGINLKALVVHMSQFQLKPVAQIREHVIKKFHIPIDDHAILEFNKQAFQKLVKFEKIVKEKLCNSAVVRVEETSIILGDGKRFWFHSVSNDPYRNLSSPLE